MEFELKNAQADNIALQARVNQLQQCNVLIVSNQERISAQVTAGFKEKEALESKIRELSKAPNNETFNNMVAVNRMYKSEVVQLRDHCNLLAPQFRDRQDSIAGKGLCPSFLSVPQLQNPPPI